MCNCKHENCEHKREICGKFRLVKVRDHHEEKGCERYGPVKCKSKDILIRVIQCKQEICREDKWGITKKFEGCWKEHEEEPRDCKYDV